MTDDVIPIYTQPDIISSYLCQFAAQTVETLQAYSPTGNIPAAIKVLFTWQLILFQSPPT